MRPQIWVRLGPSEQGVLAFRLLRTFFRLRKFLLSEGYSRFDRCLPLLQIRGNLRPFNQENFNRPELDILGASRDDENLPFQPGILGLTPKQAKRQQERYCAKEASSSVFPATTLCQVCSHLLLPPLEEWPPRFTHHSRDGKRSAFPVGSRGGVGQTDRWHKGWRTRNEVTAFTSIMNNHRTRSTAQACEAQVASEVN